MAENDGTLFGQPGSYRMDLLELRNEPLKPAEIPIGARNTRVAVVRAPLRRRRWPQRLPGLRNAVRRVLRQETMQQRRATPRQPRDDNRSADLLSGNLGVLASIPLEKQPIREMADDGLSSRDSP